MCSPDELLAFLQFVTLPSENPKVFKYMTRILKSRQVPTAHKVEIVQRVLQAQISPQDLSTFLNKAVQNLTVKRHKRSRSANGSSSEEPNEEESEIIQLFKQIGSVSLTLLQSNDPKVAATASEILLALIYHVDITTETCLLLLTQLKLNVCSVDLLLLDTPQETQREELAQEKRSNLETVCNYLHRCHNDKWELCFAQIEQAAKAEIELEVFLHLVLTKTSRKNPLA
jgi:hypothetical protein